MTDEDLLRQAYAAYNARDVERLLRLVADDVDWPAGPLETARLRGSARVRAYWLEQWTSTHTHDEPVGFRALPDGRTAVDVRHVVRGLDGTVLSASRFTHVHQLEAGRITRLDIEPAPPQPL